MSYSSIMKTILKSFASIAPNTPQTTPTTVLNTAYERFPTLSTMALVTRTKPTERPAPVPTVVPQGLILRKQVPVFESTQASPSTIQSETAALSFTNRSPNLSHILAILLIMIVVTMVFVSVFSVLLYMSGYDLRMIRDAIEKQRARRRFHLKTPKPSSPPKSHATYSKISGYDTSYSTALRIPHSALPVRTEVTVTSTRRRHPAIPYPFPKSGDTNISLLSSIPQSPASMSILDTPSYIAQLNRFNNREEEIDAEAHTPLRTPSTPSVLSFVQSPRPSISQVSPFTPIRDGHDVTPTGSMRGGDGNGYGRRTSIGNGIHGNFKMGVRGMNRLVRFMVGSEVEEEDGGLPVREDT